MEKRVTYYSCFLHDVGVVHYAIGYHERDVQAFPDKQNIHGQVSVSYRTRSRHGQILQPVATSRAYGRILLINRVNIHQCCVHSLHSAYLCIVRMPTVSCSRE